MQAIIQAWLDNQCGHIHGATGAVVLLLPRNGTSLVAAARWPHDLKSGRELVAAAKAAYQEQRSIAQPRMNGAEHPIAVGPTVSCPILVKGRTVGAVAVGLSAEANAAAPDTVDGIQRGASGFEAYLRQQSAPAPPGQNAPTAARFVPSEPARPANVVSSGVAALAPQPSPRSVAPPPPAMPQAAIAVRPDIPTLRDNVEKTIELPPANSARILHLLATLEAHDHFHEAAMAFATELATMFNCTRVSIGFSGRRHVKVEALSHTTEFRSNQGLLRSVGAAMEEAIWQGVTLVFPLPEGAQPRVDRAHADLAHKQGTAWVCTVPLVRSGKPFGAMTLERNRAEALSRSEITLCENIAALLGPLLDTKRAVDKPWHGKVALGLREGVAPLFGPGRWGVKIVVATVIATLVGASFIHGEYRVSAPARLEGSVQRVLAAPADGYLKITYVRPGDIVKTGQILAELNDEDLKLEERKAESEVSQFENSYATALVKEDRAEVAILGAKLEESRAQLDLIRTRLSRTQLQAPFDGIVITGDLSQSLGAPVKKGDALMAVAPEHDFRVIIEVDERDVSDVKLSQPGYLALSALPGEKFPVEIARITPVSTTGDGRNYFEVEARLTADAGPDLRPGLLGVAKVDAGARPLLWIWTHRVYDWVRLTVWSWIG